MAEDLLFHVVEKLIGKLGSLAVESWNVRDDLGKLVDDMEEIKAVVMDAEEQQSTNRQVKVWVDKLKDALYDAEDLLDEFSTEGLRRQVMTRDKKAKKFRIFFSSSNQLLFSFKMSQKIKTMRKTIEALNVGRRNFHFANRTPEQRVARHRDQTHSFIREEYVIGREEEKEALLEMLLNTSVDVKENVSIISIIGIGGLGKTALAQLLFNDKAVQKHFEPKKWVCVSDGEFVVKDIASKIIESKTNDDMDQVQQKLRAKIEGKRYLLVLDDVWNEGRERWLQLMNLLKDGAEGSKIIITTRSKEVAKINGPSSPFELKGLDGEKSWNLFSQLAFENGKEPENQRLVSIGKEIVKICSGVPLAIRCIGSLMYSMKTEDEWLNFKDKDLVKINEDLLKIKQKDDVNEVLQLLKLSYDHLPFHLKKCLSFCSLFPKDYDIRPTKLIQLWAAHGFVESSDERCLEDVGKEYFMNLADRSFFQDLKSDDITGEMWGCKMHDLVHDLAKFVSGNDFVMVSQEGQHSVDKRTRHLSLGFPLDSSWQVPSSLLKACKLRTFLLPQHQYPYYFGELSMEESACNLIMSSFEQLRVLNLNFCNLRMMPSCIGRLKHLRYLDLSYNEEIEVLPESITKLNNLQTLLLKSCSNLRELPRDLCELTSLRHLDLYGNRKIEVLPGSITKLNNLQTLLLNGCSKLRELPRDLWELTSLRYLDLSDNEEIEVLPGSITKLKNLQTLLLNGCSKLRELPGDLWELTSLRHLNLNGCDKLSFMPRGIGQLTNLQTLTVFVLDRTFTHSGGASELRGLNNLRGRLQIKGLECLRNNPTEAEDVNIIGKSQLQDLDLTWGGQINDDDNDADKDNIILQALLPHHNIKRLWISEFGGVRIPGSVNSFANLLHMSLKGCARLQYLPQLHLLPNLESLSLCNLPCLEWINNDCSNDSSSTFFPSLKRIYLKGLQNLKGWCRCSEEGMPRGCCHQFKSLGQLCITDCPNLISIPQHTYIRDVWLQNVSGKILEQAVNHSEVEILTISRINDLKSLSEVLHHLTALRQLLIGYCEELDVCSDEEGSYSMQWKQLNNLQSLRFWGIPKMECLPDWVQHLTTLKRLDIWKCENLRCIPEGISSLRPTLEEIKVKECPKLTSFPEWI